MAYFIFNELLSVLAIAGVGVTVIGVALIMHGSTNKQAL
jgi:drug/metabolite transporter (DMT)-like permease